MGLSGKTVLVVGTGISGIAAVNLLATQSANIILLDGNTELSPETVAAKFSEDIHYDLILGDLPDQVMDRIDLAVLSPGVPTDLPFVVRMQEAGIPIWGEIELAYVCGKGKVVAITGTNGKTTTTALTGEIMKAYYDSVFVVGNIGLPYTQYAMQMRDDTVTVAEVSSFQLETIHKFCPQVSAILNITPDHLNRHHTMECYTETKARVAMNQTKEQMCVLNYEDERLQQVAKNMSADVFWFSSARELERGIFLRGEEIVCRDGEEITLCNIHDLKLLGMHNYENVMAAAAIAHGMNVPWDVIRKVVCDFHKPTLDAIGFQELIAEEAAAWSTETTENYVHKYQSLGKQPSWIEYTTDVNETYGEFAAGMPLAFMCLNRIYEQGINRTITNASTYIDPTIYNNIFAESRLSSQNFWVQVAFDVTARRVMSAKQIPNL